MIHKILLLIFSTISASAHIVAIILFGVITFWIGAVFALGKEFNLLTKSLPLKGAGEAPALPVLDPQATLQLKEEETINV